MKPEVVRLKLGTRWVLVGQSGDWGGTFYPTRRAAEYWAAMYECAPRVARVEIREVVRKRRRGKA